MELNGDCKKLVLYSYLRESTFGLHGFMSLTVNSKFHKFTWREEETVLQKVLKPHLQHDIILHSAFILGVWRNIISTKFD